VDSSDFQRALKRSWLIIAMAAIAGALGGYWVYGSEAPLYQSSVQMIVSSRGGPNVDGVSAWLLESQRAVALSQVASTAPALEAAQKAAGYPDAAVSATSAPTAQAPFLTVSVVGQSPAVAKAVADEFAPTLPATMVAMAGRADSTIQVRNLAPACLPGKPFSPSIARQGWLGVAAGLLLGIMIALVREALDRTVRDSADVSELTGLTILGTIPRDLPRKLLPAASSPRSARAEAYRQVRTTLINARPPRLRTMAITSASVGEGKTSVATNVAAAFSRAGCRVAVVDADLRRPCVATFFGLRPERGLTDVLAGTCSLREALTLADNGRLAVLTSGAPPANPSEALAGAAMKDVLRQLADEYDYVLIDTPPVLPVSDPLVLAPLVDGVIFVIQLGRTTRDRFARATKALQVSATIVGVVLNKSGSGRDRDYRYPYYAPARNRHMRGRRIDPSVPVPVNGSHPRSASEF
jgi:capsular exopolysaccharide synthesis family protein